MPPGHCRAWGSRPGAVPGGILGGGRRGDKGADLHTEYTPVRSRLRPRTVHQPRQERAELDSDKARTDPASTPSRTVYKQQHGAALCPVLRAALPSGTDAAHLQRSRLPPQLQMLFISRHFIHSSLPSRSGIPINDKLVLKIAMILVTKPALFHHRSHFCPIYYVSQNNSEHHCPALGEGW